MTARADLTRALDRWQRAAGPYWMYVTATPFLHELAGPRSSRRTMRGGADVLKSVAPMDEACAVFVDRPPLPTLRIAPDLNRLGYWVVPVIQRWCASPAVVRSENLVDALAEVSEALVPLDDTRGVVFLLDGDRLGPGGRRVRQAGGRMSVFDNRYEYPVDRFPPPELFLRNGIRSVRWIGGDLIAPDLQGYGRRLAEAGLNPELITSHRA